ncbi:TPA: hypothetical protein IAA87_10730 [Candidatus Avigastranaerophilus faecigallinarum]|nr:hypothetical protein [Candidatus Avigastranaerophilus faecigallinarum]
MLKRIFINLLLIIMALTFVEAYSFNRTKIDNEKFKTQADRLEANSTRQYKTQYRLLEPFNTTLFRNSFIKDNANNIVWFGCSFAEGAGLNDNQTPCYKISELTGKSCINKAKGATGAQFMYYQINDDKIMDDAKTADFIIYTFIWNHIQRLYNYQVNPLIDMFNLRYKIIDGNLVDITPQFNPLYSSFFVKRILNKIVFEQAKQESYNFRLFNKIMKETYNISQKRYPNSKFIFIEFPELSKKELPDYEVKELESYGIKVIRVKDIIGNIDIYDPKYWLPDNIHPTEQAWDLILPIIVEKYMN